MTWFESEDVCLEEGMRLLGGLIKAGFGHLEKAEDTVLVSRLAVDGDENELALLRYFELRLVKLYTLWGVNLFKRLDLRDPDCFGFSCLTLGHDRLYLILQEKGLLWLCSHLIQPIASLLIANRHHLTNVLLAKHNKRVIFHFIRKLWLERDLYSVADCSLLV